MLYFFEVLDPPVVDKDCRSVKCVAVSRRGYCVSFGCFPQFHIRCSSSINDPTKAPVRVFQPEMDLGTKRDTAKERVERKERGKEKEKVRE